MTALLQEQVLADQTKIRRTNNFKRWLRHDLSVNLAIEMYTGDNGVDQSERHEKGHSSSDYYVTKDENDTLAIGKKQIDRTYKNFADMGVGGYKAVRRALDVAECVGAENYLGCDIAVPLLNGAVGTAKRAGFNAIPIFCDIFEALPFHMRNTLIAVLGLGNQNMETFKNPYFLKDRAIRIFKNYARAITSSDPAIKSNSGLLVGWDANMNAKEVKACYDNAEFGGLVCGLFDGEMPIDKFEYHVIARNVKLRGDEEMCELATGLRARVAHTIEYDGEDFPIQVNTFYPVLNSSRFNVPLMVDIQNQSGFRPDEAQRWTATGRVHYQHAPLADLRS